MDEFARATAKTNQGDAVTSTEAPAVPVEKTAGTRYVVLHQRLPVGEHATNPASWYEIDEIHATSAEAAIRLTIGNKDWKGALVAIPSRSWKPVKVTVTSKPVITLEDA